MIVSFLFLLNKQTDNIDKALCFQQTELMEYKNITEQPQKLLKNGQKEDYLLAFDSIYKYGAILYIEYVQKNREKISKNKLKSSEELIGILKLAGAITISSNLKKVEFTPLFRAFHKGYISDSPTEWDYDEFSIFYRFAFWMLGKDKINKDEVKKIKESVEKTYKKRGLGLLETLKKLASTYPNPNKELNKRKTEEMPKNNQEEKKRKEQKREEQTKKREEQPTKKEEKEQNKKKEEKPVENAIPDIPEGNEETINYGNIYSINNFPQKAETTPENTEENNKEKHHNKEDKETESSDNELEIPPSY